MDFYLVVLELCGCIVCYVDVVYELDGWFILWVRCIVFGVEEGEFVVSEVFFKKCMGCY